MGLPKMQIAGTKYMEKVMTQEHWYWLVNFRNSSLTLLQCVKFCNYNYYIWGRHLKWPVHALKNQSPNAYSGQVYSMRFCYHCTDEWSLQKFIVHKLTYRKFVCMDGSDRTNASFHAHSLFRAIALSGRQNDLS